jgi:hypothetical protein
MPLGIRTADHDGIETARLGIRLAADRGTLWR